MHVPVEFAATVYDALHGAGRPYGLIDAGYRAIETLRLEKGYRAWGADIGPDHTPDMAGLGWAVRKTGDFQGRAALEAARKKPQPRLFAGFLVDDPDVVLWGRETIYRNGERCGWLSSAGFGHSLGRPIGWGYVRDANGVDAGYVLSGDYELEVAGDRVPARVTLKPFYDPSSARTRS